MLVFLTVVPGAYLIDHTQNWPLVWRLAIAVIPLIATLLYVRSTARWVRGMDELHRHVVVEAFLWATVGYLVLGAVWFSLNTAGVWAAVAYATGLHLERIQFSNWTTILCLTYVLFGIGYSRLNRRYR